MTNPLLDRFLRYVRAHETSGTVSATLAGPAA